MVRTQNPNFIFFIYLLFLTISATKINGKMQQNSIFNLVKSGSKQKSGVDTSLFDASLSTRIVNTETIVENARLSESNNSNKKRDRIEKLPGQPKAGFKQYGGYVTVDQTAGRSMYYYFTEAQFNSSSLPLLLWLNGGPGCSSLAYGAMQELGPFRVASDGKTLFTNKYSWNNAANVLFLESPAGVGFSYSNRTSDYETSGDKRTAEDNYLFLVNWLERFPEYKNRDFYISGESYAGHYVPQLAHTILFHNTKVNKTIINLKGIIIGNAVINEETDDKGMYDYIATHAIISDQTNALVKKNCDFTKNILSDDCNKALAIVDNNIRFMDIYSIYAPICHSFDLTVKPKKHSVINYDPCSDNYVYAYLNRKDVQIAMHANITNIPYDWEPCSDVITKWVDSASTVLPLLHEFIDHGLRVWIFSGDTDGVVPVTSTKYSLKKMNLAIQTQWHPWFVGGEVGGFTEVYKGDLTFATVRGAGHQVPSFQPFRAFSLIKHFLDGTSLPYH